MDSNKDGFQIQRDQQGNPLMTLNNIKFYCRKDYLPQAPELNDKLYLYEKGFIEIQSLSPYCNILSLWLNGNKISTIKNLQSLHNLVCLYLNNNQIKKIQGLNSLTRLQVINLQKNRIQCIENLQNLSNLKSLNIAENCLSDLNSIIRLKDINKLNSLDLSKNQIMNHQQIFEVLKSLKILTCLSLKSTPFSRGFKNYRKNMIANLPLLKFLDDRPVQQSDHRLCQAWLKGGQDNEKSQRKKIHSQQTKKAIQQREQKENQKLIKFQNYSIKSNVKKDHQTIEQSSQKDGQTKQQYLIDQQQLEYGKNNQQKQLKSGKNNIDWNGWKKQYGQILQILLQRHKFDFSEVQPQFNMIINEINKKLSRSSFRFQIKDLEKIWTSIQVQTRKKSNI